ncbi:Mitochondrial ornithine transporter 2, partial [Caligus rogercresseyi]
GRYKNDVFIEEGRWHSVADLLSGSLAGCANVLVGLPFDTLKVKMQTYPGVYPSFPSAMVKTFRNEGVLRGFYSGYGPSLGANVGENAVLFFAYGWCREWVLPQFFGIPSTSGPLWNAVAGSMASTFSSLVLCPTEMVKCRLQSSDIFMRASRL